MTDNPNQNKIEGLEEKIKIAYRDNAWSEVKSIAQEIKTLDAQNHLAVKLLEKAQKVEAEALAALARKKAESFKPKGPSLASRLMTWWKAKRKTIPATLPKISVAPPVQASAPVAVLSTPAVPAKPIPAAPLKPVPASKAPAAPAPAAAKTSEKKGEANGGNMFTKIFGKTEMVEAPKPSKSILDTIVSKTEVKPIQKLEKPVQKTDTTGLRFLNFSSAFLQFAVFFIFITAGFFYAQNLDQENRIVGLFGKESYASRLHGVSERLTEKQEEVKKLSQEIKRFEEGYNNRYEKIVEGIAKNRLNWPEILVKINEITNAVYEGNELSQYIQYSNFSFDASKGLVRVSGTLTDPLGKNLTKLVEIEEAFRNYPRDPANPDDPTKPYFYNLQEFNSLRKSLDKRTGRYTSSFQLAFALNPGQPKQ